MLPESLANDPPKHRSQIRLLRAIMRANAALRDSHKEAFRPLGLNIAEFDFLAALGNTDGLRMKDLAHHMITTPSNVTRICATMEKKGLAVRERSSESDREVIAKLTPEGQKRFEECFPVIANFSTGLIDELASEDEQRAAATILEKLIAKLESRG
jgi:DNA-binding MarR family transcriptional regulator